MKNCEIEKQEEQFHSNFYFDLVKRPNFSPQEKSPESISENSLSSKPPKTARKFGAQNRFNTKKTIGKLVSFKRNVDSAT